MKKHRIIRFFCLLTVFAAWSSANLLVADQPRIEARAILGKPFGVGRITLDASPDMLPLPLGVDGIGLSERDGRAFYPVVDDPAIGKLVRQWLDNAAPATSNEPVRQGVQGLLQDIFNQPPRVTIYFLFRGDEPLHLSLQLKDRVDFEVVPKSDAAPRAVPELPRLRRNGVRAAVRNAAGRDAGHAALLEQWWRHYAKNTTGVLSPKRDDPPLLDTYLTAMLARRLDLKLPERKQLDSQNILRREIGLNAGFESLHTAMMQDRVLGLGDWSQAAADLPANAGVALKAKIPPKPAGVASADVKIEPIAKRVPVECFYLRFGSFANFLWMQDTLARWGGDAQNLIAMRGLEHNTQTAIERQLVLKQTTLSRLFGDAVISDVAIIGTDMFFREGASYGILFHAKNNFTVTRDFNQQRQERIAKKEATEEKVKIAGREVSYLSSPDGRVRSYYAIDGDFHFVTTSRRLVELFFATKSGKNSLGDSPAFQHARTVMPISRNDTVWLYASSEFFDNLTSLQYRLEMTRRLQATIDIEIVEMARLAAAAEGRPCETVEQLKSGGFLPSQFGPLPDGSAVVLKNGEAIDSLRGHRGAFTPTADMQTAKATPAELAEYRRFDEYRRDNWGFFDPIVVGVKRTPAHNGRERVVVDATLASFAAEHFDTLRKWIGEPDAKQLAPVVGNAAQAEAVLAHQRVFLGLYDHTPSAYVGAARWFVPNKYYNFLSSYIGTTGETGDVGVLSVFNIGIPPESDPAGYAMSPLGGWRRHVGDFTVFSYQREVLDAVTPQLRFEQAGRPAQIRVHVGDLSSAQIAPTLNDLGYARTRETSLGNLRFFQALNQQLRVPPAACRETAERLLGTKTICPLGGQYVLVDATAGNAAYWTTTALQASSAGAIVDTKIHAPAGYQAAPLRWFRGLALDAAMTQENITVHADVLMQMK